uniref:Uncharacterized protein n=1 Tax=Molossus molossus TaxID=27622 RepID=A0A7J8JVE6_MOLMO|nr:hypothetical protein HJG59_007867 [Molossus molossus]
MMPTHFRKGDFIRSTIQMLISSRNTLTVIPRNTNFEDLTSGKKKVQNSLNDIILMTYLMMLYYYSHQFDSAVRVSAHRLKGHKFDSQSRAHTWVASLIPSSCWGHAGINQLMCLSYINVSFLKVFYLFIYYLNFFLY